MSISEREFQEMLKNNPALRERLMKQAGKKQTKTPHKLSPQTNMQINKQSISAAMQIIDEINGSEKNKYGNTKLYEYESGKISQNKKEENDGKVVAVYDSIKEYNRWCELRLLQKAGQIKNLQRQVRLVIQESFTYHNERIRAVEYVADFLYVKGDTTVIEDVKPFDNKTQRYRLTKDFSLKWKFLKHKYPEYYFEIF